MTVSYTHLDVYKRQGIHQTAGRKCPSAERFEDGGQRERAFHERQGKDGYHRPVSYTHLCNNWYDRISCI